MDKTSKLYTQKEIKSWRIWVKIHCGWVLSPSKTLDSDADSISRDLKALILLLKFGILAGIPFHCLLSQKERFSLSGFLESRRMVECKYTSFYFLNSQYNIFIFKLYNNNITRKLQNLSRQTLQDLPHINSWHNIDKCYKISVIQD